MWLPGAGCSAGSLAGAGFDTELCTDSRGSSFIMTVITESSEDCFSHSFSSFHGGVSLHVRAAVRGD